MSVTWNNIILSGWRLRVLHVCILKTQLVLFVKQFSEVASRHILSLCSSVAQYPQFVLVQMLSTDQIRIPIENTDRHILQKHSFFLFQWRHDRHFSFYNAKNIDQNIAIHLGNLTLPKTELSFDFMSETKKNRLCIFMYVNTGFQP